MKCFWYATSIAICVSLSTPPLGAAQDQNRDEQRDEQRTQQKQDRNENRRDLEDSPKQRIQSENIARGELRSANDIIGMNIENARGENIAEVDDIILDHDQNRVAYVIASYGGFLNVGDSHSAIPWQALRMSNDRNLTLDMETEQLKNAPTFDPENLPTVDDPAFHKEMCTFYGVKPYELDESRMKNRENQARQSRGRQQDEAQLREEQQEARAQRQGERQRQADTKDDEGFDWTAWSSRDDKDWSRRLSELIGVNVKNRQNENIAELEDVLIDAREGRIAYALVSYGDTLGFFGHTAAVPWRALDLDEQDQTYSLAATSEDLDKVRVDARNYKNLEGDSLAKRVHETFDQDPYWIAYGYTDDRQPEHSRRGESGKPSSDGDIQISGTVESVGRFPLHQQNQSQQRQQAQRQEDAKRQDPKQQAEENGTRLRVRAHNGEYHTVHIASQDKLKEEDLNLSRGDRITISGTEKQYRGYKVIQAERIQANGKTVQVASGPLQRQAATE